VALLIDGYNLLHASGIIGRGRGPGGLQRSRQGLIEFLIASLDPAELARTTIVFDAAEAPPGLPRQYVASGITIRFASGYESADELIEELIRQDTTPRQLTVVSSDHRLHRAARRRKAAPVDSDRWYVEQLRRRGQPTARQRKSRETKPIPDVTEAEIEYWIAQFSQELQSATAPDVEEAPSDSTVSNDSVSLGIPEIDSLVNPFPPGYAEDIREDEIEPPPRKPRPRKPKGRK
jgi:predicted RNA-binding protein with PIN domain